MTFKTWAVLSTAVMISTSAFAEDSSTMTPYIGFDTGVMKINFDSVTEPYFEDSFRTVSPYVGLHVTDSFAVEGGYLASSEGSKLVGSGHTDLSFSGFYLDGVGKYNVTEKLTALASVGMARLKADVSATGAGGSLTANETETSLRFGAGGEYVLTDNLNARGMIRYMDTGFDGVDNALQYTIGLNYAF